MAYYGYDWAYTFDNRHGFGIQFGTEEAKGKFTSCFYEDGTLEHGEYLRKLQKCIDEMRRYGRYGSGKRDDSVTISTEDGRMIAKVRTAYGEHTVTVSEEGHGWTNCECSCGRRSCSHMETAGLHVVRRLGQLQHTYVVSEKAVDKSLFLESRLENAVSTFRMPTLEMGEIEKVRDIIGMVREAKSDRYYLNFHELVLDQNDYYGYEPHLMETKYRNLLLGAFEDPGYKKAVLDSDEFAGIVVGGGKQYRSNRASVKRLLKEYEKTVKQLEKGSYEENGQKEFLLKYRADWTGLLRFFGCMARKINDSDLPFLEKILEAQEVSFEKEFESVRNLAVKLDAAVSIMGVKEIFAKFMERLTPQMRIDTYALLRNMSMTAEDIRTLSREDQLKMVRNTPLSADTVRYILSDLMAGESERVRGNFVFYVLSSAFDYPYSVPKDQQGAIGDALLEEIRKLPDSRLLHAYVKERIGREEKRKSSVRKKDPIREIGTYFACSYEIVRRERSMYVTYSVRNPETNGIIMALREEDGQVFSISFSDKYGYTPEEVRSVCLHGHEEEYRREFEKTQDNLAAAIFEKEHIQF
ncbi:MAG: hypothetical protein IJ083_17240, partial [Clostridia bacterium]|nr:hypothetical protein [Clostridia bacterium]